MKRTVTTLSSLLLLTATLTGCGPGGSTEPGKLPSELKATSAPSPISTPTGPTPPARPAAVEKKNKAGAIAATTYFLEALTYSGPSNDTKPLRDSFSDFCTRCDGIADGVESVWASGGSVEGGGWVPARFKFHAIKRDVAYVDAIVDERPQVWTARAGAEPVSTTGRRNVLRAFQLEWKPKRGWVVAALDPNQ